MNRCKCGKEKPRRFSVCSECFKKMPEAQKNMYRATSEIQKQGTLRRWPQQ